MGYDDRLDLLGVRFDAEMELRALYELAESVAIRCKDEDDFKKACIKLIEMECPSDVDEVWKIIEENFNK